MRDALQPKRDDAQPCGGLQWRTRYEGLVAVAYLGDKAVAGVSGPWSGRFALTWWERPLPARQLLLFDTLEDAKHEVESWALRVRAGRAAPLPGFAAAPPAHKPALVERARTLLAELRRPKPDAAAIERLRRRTGGGDVDLGGLHFAAHD